MNDIELLYTADEYDELVDENTQLKSQLQEAKEEIETLKDFLSYARTVRKNNTTEWMEGFAEDMNSASAKIGSDQRFKFDGDFIKLESRG